MTAPVPAAEVARQVRDRLPPGGLFADQSWRVAPAPFPLAPEVVRDLESLGRVLLQFNRAVNRLYRLSVEGRQPEWVARLLDQGKPADLIALQRHPALKHAVPRVIRPDCLLTEQGLSITELDSVPGGIGLTAWLNETYAAAGAEVLGGPTGMHDGFAGIFGDAPRVHLTVSAEAAGYRPEMAWLAERLDPARFAVRDTAFTGWQSGDAVYRFFELFDLPNIEAAPALWPRLLAGEIQVTPPPKPIFEEKLLFALLWNRNLRGFWRQELGEGFFQRLLKLLPYTWVVDPAPLPPHAAIPELNLTDWQQLKTLSQRERELILKVSGFSELAWGSRGVHLGSDLSAADWGAAVDGALGTFPRSPHVLQRFHRTRVVEAAWFDFAAGAAAPMPARARLCPYYFVHGEGDAARAQLGGVLATLCPADKKIIHGMKDAVLAPCAVAADLHPAPAR
ncbi:MAG: hypothetical protein RJA22_1205 [Verrucomicrobiota bacterium]